MSALPEIEAALRKYRHAEARMLRARTKLIKAREVSSRASSMFQEAYHAWVAASSDYHDLLYREGS